MGTRYSKNITMSVIIKIINIYELSDVNYLNSLREIEIATDIMNNPNDNIIIIYDIIKLDTAVYIVMEYCSDGDLSSLLIKPLKEHIAKYYFNQLVSGVKYIQQNKIIHCDIKPKNIMLANNKKTLKLTDFGLAKMHDRTKSNNTISGSPLYMAPELLNFMTYGEDVDVWALGIILFEMLFGMHPFKDCKDYEELQLRTINYVVIPPLNSEIIVSDNCISLLKQMLSPNKNRVKIDDILSDSWLKIINEPNIISMKTIFIENNIDISTNSSQKDLLHICSDIDCELLFKMDNIN
jgi:serine/threonine protein kinase